MALVAAIHGVREELDYWEREVIWWRKDVRCRVK